MARKKHHPGEVPTVPATARPAYEAVVGLTDAFCREHLNEEYIVRTIGRVNFLDDRGRGPHLKLTAIDKAFGVAESTGHGKSNAIRTLLKIRPFDPQWTLPSRMDENPMAWMIEVNGFVVDARHLKREFQEEAFRKGLIPCIREKEDR